MRYFAHTAGKTQADWQPLAEHLRNVAMLARAFAQEARPGDKALDDVASPFATLHVGFSASGIRRGRRTEKIVCPGLDVKRMSPLWRSTTIR